MASCFSYSKGDKHHSAGKTIANGKPKTLASILNVKTDRRGRSSRRQHQEDRIHHLGLEDRGRPEGLERSRSAMEHAPPRRSFTLLVDHIQSVSQRFTSSSNFSHSQVSEIREEVARDIREPPTQVIRGKKSQAGSSRKSINTRSNDDHSKGPATAAADEKLKPYQLQCRRLSRRSSHRLNDFDKKNFALMVAPLNVDDIPELHEIEPVKQQAGEHENASPGSSQNTLFHVEHNYFQTNSVLQNRSGPLNQNSDDPTTPSVPISDWEKVLDMSVALNSKESGRSTIETEQEKAEKRDEIVEVAPDSQPLTNGQKKSLQDAIVYKRDVKALQTELGRNGVSSTATGTVDEEHGIANTLTAAKAVDEDHGIVNTQTAAKTVDEDHGIVNTQTAAKTVDEEHGIGNTQTGSEKTVDEDHGIARLETAARIVDGEDHGVANMQSNTEPQPEILHGTSRRLSSVSDNEAVARLWEQIGMVDDVQKPAQTYPFAEEKSLVIGKNSPAAAGNSTTRRRRRRVRFSTCGGSGADFSLVDISATLLGKLSATKHHQVRYLQDELAQTRAQVAQLEQDCQAQRDLKLAFKVQALRLGAALKKLREFALENGLDPRGVEGKSPPETPQTLRKFGDASDFEHRTKEIESSPELNLLKAEAEQFGWLCDSKEVELREQIGSGSTADIFKGVWHNLDVAVKCLRPDVFGGDTDAIDGFCKEVELLSRQRHPYVLRMFAACLSPPDHAWIVTEYLSSGTLAEWLHGTKTREKKRIVPLPLLSERLRIATEISMAMQYLHELSPKVLHRDLKPSNILLDGNNHVRISDFNCARYFNGEEAVLTGETGTYVYMAPEVMAHESYDEKCDIYSFAVILCELVTGNPPYIDKHYSPAEIACKVSQGILRPTLPEDQPELLVELIKDAWEQEPTKRPSFSGVTATLEVITGDFFDFLESSPTNLADTFETKLSSFTGKTPSKKYR